MRIAKGEKFESADATQVAGADEGGYKKENRIITSEESRPIMQLSEGYKASGEEQYGGTNQMEISACNRRQRS